MGTSRSLLPARFVSLVKDLQPQYAAYLAICSPARHVIPAAKNTVLTLDVGDGLQAEALVADILEAATVAPGTIAVERNGPIVELFADDVDALPSEWTRDAPPDVAAINITNKQVIPDVSFDYAIQVNRSRRGSLVVPGDSLLVLVCENAGDAGWLANQIESLSDCLRLVDIDMRGGMVVFAGPPASIRAVAGQCGP